MSKLLNKIYKLLNSCELDNDTKNFCKRNKYSIAKNILSSSDYNIDRIDEKSYPKILSSVISIEKNGETPTFIKNTKSKLDFIKNTKSKSDYTITSRYKIISILGCGAQGCVYFAYDTKANENVIIKSGKDLANEKRILKILNKYSKNFPIYLGSFVDAGQTYIVTKPFLDGNLPGSDLSKFLSVKKLTPAEMKRLYLNILSSVYQMNNLGVKHKDLKPQNILVNNDLDIQIIDFGVACYKTDKRCIYGFSRKYQPIDYTGNNLRYTEINDLYSVVQILGDIIRSAKDINEEVILVGDSFDEKLKYLKENNLNLHSIYELLREYCVSQDCMNFIYIDELINLIDSL